MGSIPMLPQPWPRPRCRGSKRAALFAFPRGTYPPPSPQGDGGRPRGRPDRFVTCRRCHTCFRFIQMSDLSAGEGVARFPPRPFNKPLWPRCLCTPCLSRRAFVTRRSHTEFDTDVAQWKSAGFGNQGSQVRVLPFVPFDRIRKTWI